jgi:hypothetical protein
MSTVALIYRGDGCLSLEAIGGESFWTRMCTEHHLLPGREPSSIIRMGRDRIFKNLGKKRSLEQVLYPFAPALLKSLWHKGKFEVPAESLEEFRRARVQFVEAHIDRLPSTVKSRWQKEKVLFSPYTIDVKIR